MIRSKQLISAILFLGTSLGICESAGPAPMPPLVVAEKTESANWHFHLDHKPDGSLVLVPPSNEKPLEIWPGDEVEIEVKPVNELREVLGRHLTGKVHAVRTTKKPGKKSHPEIKHKRPEVDLKTQARLFQDYVPVFEVDAALPGIVPLVQQIKGPNRLYYTAEHRGTIRAIQLKVSGAGMQTNLLLAGKSPASISDLIPKEKESVDDLMNQLLAGTHDGTKWDSVEVEKLELAAGDLDTLRKLTVTVKRVRRINEARP